MIPEEQHATQSGQCILPSCATTFLLSLHLSYSYISQNLFPPQKKKRWCAHGVQADNNIDDVDIFVARKKGRALTERCQSETTSKMLHFTSYRRQMHDALHSGPLIM